MANPTGRGGFKKADLTTDEIRDLEQRIEMIEPDQGVLALTDGMESAKPRNIGS